MYRITRFQELLKGLPRGSFDKTVRRLEADKYSKHFGHWEHLVAMLYGQWSGASSLRVLEAGYNSHLAHHYHLRTGPIKRSTLADANSNRAETVFADVAQQLMQQAGRQMKRQGQELLYLLDSTSITLKGREFERWTRQGRTRNTQGIKLHVLFGQSNQVPLWHSISRANVNDVDKARDLPLEPGATYVFDKAYCDYNWWHDIGVAGGRFVTRFKKNAGLKVTQERSLDESNPQVLRDEIVCFKYKNPGGQRRNRHDKPLRRIVLSRPEKAKPLVLATNDLLSPASDIARLYKQRWDIELFFKWIKQHLKIKSFFGRSENAVRIQLLTALISYLLLAIYRQTHGLKQSLWECLALVRSALFQRPAIDDSYYRKRRREQALFACSQMQLI